MDKAASEETISIQVSNLQQHQHSPPLVGHPLTLDTPNSTLPSPPLTSASSAVASSPVFHRCSSTSALLHVGTPDAVSSPCPTFALSGVHSPEDVRFNPSNTVPPAIRPLREVQSYIPKPRSSVPEHPHRPHLQPQHLPHPLPHTTHTRPTYAVVYKYFPNPTPPQSVPVKHAPNKIPKPN
ncbi:hypothetical protein EJ06DRAFT_108537 [Trichodelitschia bisporula]|uniref:Uncharacterized protein n=1 Tax=Trichodelitschia bisporula TaxID=703511 RepID=A0A6G1HQZ4_9PEZI|nr:hypothetical protein EJ06DRAFT_108537 [Trichodelitschia bisporula]